MRLVFVGGLSPTRPSSGRTRIRVKGRESRLDPDEGHGGREALGRTRWRTFLERAADQLRHRFGDQVAYAQPLIVDAAAVG